MRIITIDSKRRFDLMKDRFNSHQTGHGAHKNKKKYSRKKKHRYEKE